MLILGIASLTAALVLSGLSYFNRKKEGIAYIPLTLVSLCLMLTGLGCLTSHILKNM